MLDHKHFHTCLMHNYDIVCILTYIYLYMYLQSAYVFGKEVIGGTTTPVHYVLILAVAAKLSVLIGDPEVGLDKCVAHWTIMKYHVEERLRGRGGWKMVVLLLGVWDPGHVYNVHTRQYLHTNKTLTWIQLHVYTYYIKSNHSGEYCLKWSSLHVYMYATVCDSIAYI